MIVLEYSSDSDDVNIRPTKRQNASVIDSDVEREHKTRSVGEHSFASTEGGTEDNISQKSEDFTGVGGVTTEGNNPLSHIIIKHPDTTTLCILHCEAG